MRANARVSRQQGVPERGVRSSSRFVAILDVVEASFMWAFSINTKARSNPPVAANKPSATKKKRRILFSILMIVECGFKPNSHASTSSNANARSVDDGQRHKKEKHRIKRMIDVMAGATVEL